MDSFPYLLGLRVIADALLRVSQFRAPFYPNNLTLLITLSDVIEAGVSRGETCSRERSIGFRVALLFLIQQDSHGLPVPLSSLCT